MSGEQGVLSPVQQETAPLRRKITSVLRQAIETGVLAAGSRLVEKDLCRDLNVSRTSLREALRELEAEGLVSYQATRGLVVTRITRAEVENIYRVRAALEALVAEQFTERRDPEAVADLRRRAEELKSAYETGDLDAILEAKRDFYESLCAGAGNPVVLDLLKRLNSRVTLLRSTSLSVADRRPRSIAEIEALVRAIETGDGPAARDAALVHVHNAAAAALANGHIDDPVEDRIQKREQADEG